MEKFTFGPVFSYNFRRDPKRMFFVLARYQFASHILKNCSSVMEIGCGEGLGVPFFEGRSYRGFDLDREAVEYCSKAYTFKNHEFSAEDATNPEKISTKKFQGVLSLDVVEHIHQNDEQHYFEVLRGNLEENGVAVIGTPSIQSSVFASKMSEMGHINLFDAKRLEGVMKEHFHTVLMFGMNDELVHTSLESSNYIFSVGIHPKKATHGN